MGLSILIYIDLFSNEWTETLLDMDLWDFMNDQMAVFQNSVRFFAPPDTGIPIR